MPNNNKLTTNVHRPDPIQFSIHDHESCWVRSGDLTLFFTTPEQATQWLRDGITAITHVVFARLNPPEPAPDAHLEPDYDDRNGD
jgi:hypothetical protein